MLVVKSQDHSKIKDITLENIKILIENFSIKEEKFINNNYIVSLDVSFNKKKIFNFLEKKMFFHLCLKKKKLCLYQF